MKKVITMLFIWPLFANGQNIANLKTIPGTWMNTEYYEYLSDLKDTIDWSRVIPRIVYLDKNYECVFENHFEHDYSTGRPIKISNREGGILSYKSNYVFNIKLKSDLSLVIRFKDGKENNFKKISNSYTCNSCGMQIFLNTNFWRRAKKWDMVRLNANKNDTQTVFFKYGGMYSALNNKLITEYEFTDDFRTSFEDEKCFNVVFFSTENNLITQKDIYVIKRRGDTICLFRDGILEIVFNPMN